MGLSVAIAGGIILSVLMLVMMSITGLAGNIFSIGSVTTQVSDLENTIDNTDISLETLFASTTPRVNFTLNNDDKEKLWNFDDFNVLIEYDNAGGTVVEELSFNGDCSGIVPSAGNWCIETIGADILDEGIINDGESGDIWTQVSQNLVSANALVTVSTDNGVVAMLPAPKRSWIDAAPIPTITCEVGNYGRTFVDTDTGISYVCDPTRDKWLSIETIDLYGEQKDNCGAGDDMTTERHCQINWGDNQGTEGLSLGLYIPYNATIIAHGFSMDADECTSGSFDITLFGSDANTDDDQAFITNLATALVDEIDNNNSLDIDLDPDQYISWGLENNCGQTLTDWNSIIYLKWRHDQP